METASRPAAAAAPVTRTEGVALAAIVAIALVARVIGLDASLWYDEVFTLTHFVRLPLADLLGSYSSLNNHMFYSLQAKLAMHLLGEHPWVLRLPAVLFGLASIVAVWRMAREAVGRGPAMLAALLLAISYHHVWFSQNARGYTGMLFWTLVATLLFVRGIARPALRTWIGYALCFAAAMYTHLSSVFFLAAHVLVLTIGALLVRRSPRTRSAYPGFGDARTLWGFGLAGVLTLLLHGPLVMGIATTMRRVAARSQPGVSSMPEWSSPLRALQEMVASVGGLGLLAPVALAGAAALAILGAIVVWRRMPLLVIVYALQVPLCIAMLWVFHLRIWPRYFFVDLGFAYLCLAAGAQAACEWLAQRWSGQDERRGARRLWLATAVTVMSIGSVVLLSRNYLHPKQDLAGAVALIERERAPGDVATSTALASEPLHAYFAPTWPTVQTAGELQQLLQSAPTIWLVTVFQAHTERLRPDVMALVAARFDLVAELPGTLGDGTVRVYRSHR